MPSYNKVESLPIKQLLDKKPLSADNKAPKNSIPSIPFAERKFIRAKDAAEYLSISKSHFHYLVRANKLPEGRLVSGAVISRCNSTQQPCC
jgi:hypothetical protein